MFFTIFFIRFPFAGVFAGLAIWFFFLSERF